MNRINIKDGFLAKKFNFCGTPGYYVYQFYKGKSVVEQFISEVDYDDFCEQIGVVPVLIESEG